MKDIIQPILMFTMFGITIYFLVMMIKRLVIIQHLYKNNLLESKARQAIFFDRPVTDNSHENQLNVVIDKINVKEVSQVNIDNIFNVCEITISKMRDYNIPPHIISKELIALKEFDTELKNNQNKCSHVQYERAWSIVENIYEKVEKYIKEKREKKEYEKQFSKEYTFDYTVQLNVKNKITEKQLRKIIGTDITEEINRELRKYIDTMFDIEDNNGRVIIRVDGKIILYNDRNGFVIA